MERPNSKSVYDLAIDNLSMPVPVDSVYDNSVKDNKIKQINNSRIVNIPLNESANNASDDAAVGRMWRDFSKRLNRILDDHSFRNVNCLIDEFVRLEKYLNDELNISENKENEIYFQSQTRIADYLDKTIKVKLFRLSQSTSIFDELKLKLANCLSSNLSMNNLNECMQTFANLEKKYQSLYDEVKSK